MLPVTWADIILCFWMQNQICLTQLLFVLGAPEGVSLLTQIILGISIGVNISIAAFIMGRYSANGDLLSFV